MKRFDTNGCTYNDTIVSRVTNTILTKDLQCLSFTYDGNGNKSGWAGLLQEEASSSPGLADDVCQVTHTAKVEHLWLDFPDPRQDGVLPTDHWVVWSVLDTVAQQRVSSTEINNAKLCTSHLLPWTVRGHRIHFSIYSRLNQTVQICFVV